MSFDMMTLDAPKIICRICYFLATFRSETDLAVAGLTYTPQRKEVIGYTIPIFAKVPVSCIAPRNQGAAINYWVYVDIFPYHVWALQAAGLSVLSLGFFLVGLTHVNRFHSEDDSENFGLLNSMALVATMIMQLTYEVGVKSASARILFYVTSVSAYLLFAYYTCDLTARHGCQMAIARFLDCGCLAF